MAALSKSQQSIYDLMNQILKSWGISTLAGDLRNLIVKGDTSPDTLSLALSQTQAYKTRFAANELRKAKGLPELQPAQYIAQEEQYRNVLRSYGMPAGFYDKQTDFTNFIANDVSPTELEQRVQVAQQHYLNAPAEDRQAWENFYGLTQGDAVARILDANHESVSTVELQRRAAAAAIGGSALANGLGTSRARAEQFVDNGVTLDNAQKAFQQIAQTAGAQTSIANRFGQDQSVNDTQALMENASLLNNGAAANKLAYQASEEQSQFGGRGAASNESNSVSANY